jgi:hypothetical protein
MAGPGAGPRQDGAVNIISREALHHGAEIALLRDLWANRRPV